MKYLMLLLVAWFIEGCNSTTDQEYVAGVASSNTTQLATLVPDPGKELLEKYCYACHRPDGTMEDRLAPPMFAVKKHYMRSNPTKEEFTTAILTWVDGPSEEKSKMPGALDKFGVMPYQVFSKDTIVKISHYLFDTEIEKPGWFDQHHQGMGKGRKGRKGRNQ